MYKLPKISSQGFLLVIFGLFFVSCATPPSISTSTPIINLQSAELTMSLDEPSTGIYYLNASTKGPYVITADVHRSGEKATLRVWDVSKGMLIKSIEEEADRIIACAISPDGEYIVSSFQKKLGGLSDKDISLRLRRLSTGEIIKSIIQPPAASVSFSRDGKYFVTSGGFDEVYTTVYDTLTGEKIRTFMMPDRGALGGIYSGVAVFSPEGKHVIVGGTDGILRMINISTGKMLRTFEGHSGWSLLGEENGGINSISFSSDGKYILSSAFFNDYIILWDYATGKELRRFTGWKDIIGRSVFSVKFAPDGKTAVFNVFGTPKFIDTESWQEKPVELKFKFEPNIWAARDPVAIAYGADSKRLFVSSGDAATRIFDSNTGEEIAIMVGFDDGEWIIITSEGYYNSSENGAKYLSVNAGNKTYDVEKFYDVFYRPDIVMAKLRGAEIKDLITITMEDAIQTPPPSVEFVAVPKGTNQAKVQVCYQAKNTGGGIGEIRLFHNGKLVHSDGYYKEIVKSSAEKVQLAALNSRAIYDDMRGLSIKGSRDSLISSQPKGDVFNDCQEIDTVSGENEVSVTAFNSSNTVQSFMKTISFRSSVTSEEPHLYILSIGIDQYKDSSVNLKYATKDANEINEKLKVQAATLYRPQNIHYQLLTDKKATKTNITYKIREISELIKPQDSFVLFVAGHGILMRDQYYMITHDYNGIANNECMISSNEIVDISKNIKSLNQLLIFDTCHAGGVDYIVSGLYDARMSVLAKKMGLHIYASANDKQTAIDGYKGNGLFSYTLLEGLNNNAKADVNNDGRVGFVELGNYSKQTTTNLSEEIGHRQTPLIINFGKDNPLYQLQ